jgi:Holliday junction resolvase RusA-like endonuclease
VTRGLRFIVRGTPVQQGSKRIGRLGGRKTGKPILIDDNDEELGPWRALVTNAAAQRMRQMWAEGKPFEQLVGPVEVDLVFLLARPGGHFGTGRNAGVVLPSAPAAPAVRPDLDKYVRACLDALTDAKAWGDDGQVVELHAIKAYGRQPGVIVAVNPSTRPRMEHR